MHGGAGRPESVRVNPAQLSVLRMAPVAARIAEYPPSTLAVFRLLNSYRGWNAQHTPVEDAQWAIEQLSERFNPHLPVSLVGHSLGGRAALLAGSHPHVVSVVALNAYLYDHDGGINLAGRRVMFAHGTRDSVASLAVAESVAHQLARSTDVEFFRIDGGKHAMLTRRHAFESTAAEFVATHGRRAERTDNKQRRNAGARVHDI